MFYNFLLSIPLSLSLSLPCSVLNLLVVVVVVGHWVNFLIVIFGWRIFTIFKVKLGRTLSPAFFMSQYFCRKKEDDSRWTSTSTTTPTTATSPLKVRKRYFVRKEIGCEEMQYLLLPQFCLERKSSRKKQTFYLE